MISEEFREAGEQIKKIVWFTISLSFDITVI